MIEYVRRITTYGRDRKGPKTDAQWWIFWFAKLPALFIAGLLLEGGTQQWQYQDWTPLPAAHSTHVQNESHTHDPYPRPR